MEKLNTSRVLFSDWTSPQNISPRSREPLQEGMIISNEPGYYKPNDYGIRIENLVTVVKSKAKGKDLCLETLTLAPITKLKKKYRCRILIRYPKNLFIQKYLSQSLYKIKTIYGIKLEVDVDPINFS